MCCMPLRCFATIALACLVAAPAVAEEANSPALIYSPWIKFCLSDTCFVGRDGRSDADCAIEVAAVLIERQGDAKRILRVTLPKRVNPERGVRIAIDQGEVFERSFGPCFANGCMADYVAGAELIDQLKQGKIIVLMAFDKANAPVSRTVPLADLASTYDGPAKEPKVFEKVQSDLQAELERRKHDEGERKARCDAR